MAKTRSLPDKFYDKDYEHNGIHRVPLWRIAGYALNNTATNVYLMMMNYAYGNLWMTQRQRLNTALANAIF